MLLQWLVVECSFDGWRESVPGRRAPEHANTLPLSTANPAVLMYKISCTDAEGCFGWASVPDALVLAVHVAKVTTSRGPLQEESSAQIRCVCFWSDFPAFGAAWQWSQAAMPI